MIVLGDIIITLMQGTLETLVLAGVSCFFGFLLGITLFLFQFYFKSSVTHAAINGFCLLIQSLPEMLILFTIYFGWSAGLSFVFQDDLEVPSFLAGTMTLALVFGAYAFKIFQAANVVILKGEVEVSCTLRLSKFQIFHHIVFPQLWHYALPGLGSLWLILLKDTVLISLIGGFDLMSRTQILIHNTHKPFEFYIVISFIYLTLTFISEQCFKKVKVNV